MRQTESHMEKNNTRGSKNYRKVLERDETLLPEIDGKTS
jgi:hypothetical protein